VSVLCARAQHVLGCPAPEWIIRETYGSSVVNLRQAISRIPGVTVSAVAGHVAVRVVKQIRGAPCRELIIRIVRRCAYSVGNPGPCEAPADRGPSPVLVVCVRQIAEEVCAERIR
jgi:hypothetical protein